MCAWLDISKNTRTYQEQNGRVLDDRTRNGNTLLLPARELAASLPNLGFQSLRKGHAEIIGVRSLGGRNHFLIRGAGLARAGVSAMVPEKRT